MKATVHTTTEVSQNDVGKEAYNLYPELTGLATSADLDEAMSKIKEECEKLSDLTVDTQSEDEQTSEPSVASASTAVENASPITKINTQDNSGCEREKDEKSQALSKVRESSAPPAESFNVNKTDTREKIVFNTIGRQKQKWLTIEQLQSLYYNPQLARNSAFLDFFVQVNLDEKG